MKKTFIATLLILIIASTTIFATPITADDSFTVKTTIAEIGLMKVSESAIAASTNDAYDTSGLFTNLGITESGTQTFNAYLTVLANKRTGYNVTMTATAMKSTVGSATSYIDYTVGFGTGKEVTTSGATSIPAINVMSKTALTELFGESQKISLSVDNTTFEKAVSGEYTGTVTFEFSAT